VVVFLNDDVCVSLAACHDLLWYDLTTLATTYQTREKRVPKKLQTKKQTLLLRHSSNKKHTRESVDLKKENQWAIKARG